jgi:hypothetical protein
MAYTYHGTSNLIALPNRTVQTYPSGLVRVERSFVCRKADAARNRNVLTLNGVIPLDLGPPAIDGLYIFPEPQENVRDDGFLEFRVSAYGRSNYVGTAVLGVQLVNLTASYTHTFTPGATPETPVPTPVVFSWTIKEIWLADTYTVTRTMLASESNSKISITPPELGRTLKYREITGTQPGMNIPGYFQIEGLFEIEASWEAALESLDRRNFGTFDEVIIAYKLTAST